MLVYQRVWVYYGIHGGHQPVWMNVEKSSNEPADSYGQHGHVSRFMVIN